MPAQNSIAEDEVQAHMNMFEATTNDAYYMLGLEAARIIRDAVMSARGVIAGGSSAEKVQGTEQQESRGENEMSLIDN